ncbi:MAG: hypothetical protein JWO11_1155 [Nocardioides sp.]|nr:hypothetical protein [Nocardioides sp.]
MDTGEWYFVSDLHLNGDPGSRDVDGALPRFLANVVGASTSGRRNLVLLGDTFDLQGPVRQSTAAVAERLMCLADAHAGILDALATCVRSGIVLHVVGGNHDIELTRPAATALFTTLLGLEVGHPGVRFSPWVVHEPGIFYAEHGNQHHDLNRMPTVLSVRERGDGQEELPVPPLGAASRASPRCSGEGAAAVRLARSLRSTQRHERMAQTSWYQGLLDREAAGLGLSNQALADLAAMSRFGAARALAAIARRTVERRVGVERPGTYLAPRAAAIHRILTRHGLPAAAYVFGHNHRAERLDLPDAPAAVYLNAGTWCTEVRGRGPDQVDRQLFPFVRIAATPGGVDADLLFWRPFR